MPLNAVKRTAQGMRVSIENAGESFLMSHGLTTAEAEVLLRKWGRNELVEKATPMSTIIFRQVMFESNPIIVNRHISRLIGV